LIDSFIVPSVHEDVVMALGRSAPPPAPTGALGIMESFTVTTLLQAADAAAKSASVTLLEIRLAMALGGKAFVTLTGDIGSVQTAVSAGRHVLTEAGTLVNAAVISRPHPDVYRELI
jgi:microcompartment protein CcmL/EutN